MSEIPIVIASAVRTPIGRFGGSFSSLPATDLAATAVKSALKRAGLDPSDIDTVILGMARQAGARPNPARQVAWHSGVPQETTAFTSNMACASGLKTIQQAADDIRL
ncbi:MAG: acetyl-CoA C-acyltransferase, partial [Planctomycetota bacterium]|nr:acetyl-CoA C-acyltransferase [Planctomycetota bacterium]